MSIDQNSLCVLVQSLGYELHECLLSETLVLGESFIIFEDGKELVPNSYELLSRQLVISWAALFVQVPVAGHADHLVSANVLLFLSNDWDFLYLFFHFHDCFWNINNFSVFSDFEFFMLNWNLFFDVIDA